MLVCDNCKSENTFLVSIIVTKVEPKKGKRKIITIPLDACDNCITILCKQLGKLKANGSLFKKEINDTNQEK